VEARFEGGQGPVGAAAPYMEWNGMDVLIQFDLLMMSTVVLETCREV